VPLPGSVFSLPAAQRYNKAILRCSPFPDLFCNNRTAGGKGSLWVARKKNECLTLVWRFSEEARLRAYANSLSNLLLFAKLVLLLTGDRVVVGV